MIKNITCVCVIFPLTVLLLYNPLAAMHCNDVEHLFISQNTAKQMIPRSEVVVALGMHVHDKYLGIKRIKCFSADYHDMLHLFCNMRLLTM